MYRADATVDMGQTEERGWLGREGSVRGEEVGEVRGSMKHGAESASSSNDKPKNYKNADHVRRRPANLVARIGGS
jgi:hypothetical protein